MTDEKRKFGRRKLFLTLFRIVFVSMSVFGISVMYLNSNYGKDVKWIYEDAYEGSPQFDKQLTEDVDRILAYVGYKDMFETDGKLDMHKVTVKVSGEPGEQGTEWTLDRIIRYIKTRGYYLDESFQLARSPISMDDDEEEITTDFQGYNPDLVDADAGDAPRMTMEGLALDILIHLSEYYTIYYNYIENDTNLNLRIQYISGKGITKVSTNVPDKTVEDMIDAGKCLFVPGNTIRMETSMTTIPANAATLLEIWNPYKNGKNYIVLSVDTNYPNTDAYSIETKVHKEARNELILGMGSIILGSLRCVVTLAMLMLMSGHTADGSTEIRLFPIDEIHTELYLILWAATTTVFIYIGRYVGIRPFSLFAPNEQWNYWNKMIELIIVYGNVILCGFDLLRRYKAGVLWGNSLTKGALEASKGCMGRVSYAVGTGFCYLLFLGFNADMLRKLIFLFFYKENRVSYQIMFYALVVLYLGLDRWIYHRLFKKSVQRDVLDMAVSTISQGDTSYRIDTSHLSGKERDMAEHLNNVSSGLGSTVQEQIKNEQPEANLITNASHDVEIPLTSIISYVDLLKREEIQDPRVAAYLEVLDQKSQHLKTLTEDLVETSEVSSGNMKLDISDIDLVELVQQINGEFEERLAMHRPELTSNIPDEVLIIQADGHCLWRVLEDPYTNTAKYTMEHSRVCVDVLDRDGKAIFTIKNVSESSLNISPDELTERFVRGGVSRAMEGSGLGLSISKDLTQLQDGKFQVAIDGDLFKAVASFPVKGVEFKVDKTSGEPGDISQSFGFEEEI